MLQTLKLTNEKPEKSLFYKEKSLLGLTPDLSRTDKQFDI